MKRKRPLSMSGESEKKKKKLNGTKSFGSSQSSMFGSSQSDLFGSSQGSLFGSNSSSSFSFGSSNSQDLTESQTSSFPPFLSQVSQTLDDSTVELDSTKEVSLDDMAMNVEKPSVGKGKEKEDELDPFEFVDATELQFDASKTKNARASTMINKSDWSKEQKAYAKKLAKGSKRGPNARYNRKGVKNKCREIHKDLDIEGDDEDQSFNHFASDLQVRLATRKYATDKKFNVPRDERRKTFLDYAGVVTEGDDVAKKEVEDLMDNLSDDEELDITPEEFVSRVTPIIADHPSNGNMGDPVLNGKIQSYTDFHTNSSNQVPRKELEKSKKIMEYGKAQFGDHATTLFGGLPMMDNKIFSSKVVKDKEKKEKKEEKKDKKDE